MFLAFVNNPFTTIILAVDQ